MWSSWGKKFIFCFAGRLPESGESRKHHRGFQLFFGSRKPVTLRMWVTAAQYFCTMAMSYTASVSPDIS